MFAEICSAGDPFSAELLKNLLEENGFHPLDIRMAAHVMIAGADQRYFVEVPVSEAAEARRCLAENGQEASLVWSP